MKTFKYVLGVLILLCSFAAFAESSVGAGLSSIILGLVILPPISDKLKEKFSFWQKKPVRYVSYVALLAIIGATLPNKDSSSSSESGISKKVLVEEGSTKEELKEQQAEEQEKKKKLLASFETCDFLGEQTYIIPDFNGANLYTALESDFGFKIDKNLKNGVDYFCTKEISRKLDYKVRMIGCSPYKIIGVTAAAIDYGIGQKEILSFVQYIAASTCREDDVEVVRNWVEANIGNESTETTIGGITFLLSHSGHSTTLQVSVEEKNILAN
ncbi:hypothetical protein [Capnocytophaga gingivalis]|uniref:hypothetical protein n=1 Tax=Capnocytophaga gingivalis TaxID=1017 RepID=UPI0028F0EB35|nr:hypothetical protein [Capnocytophaga gingivalis]